jgi:hypothetical protein
MTNFLWLLEHLVELNLSCVAAFAFAFAFPLFLCKWTTVGSTT